MLSAVRAAGERTAQMAAARARARLAAVLRAQLPRVAVTVEEDGVVLTGRVTPDDPRLRWIGSLLR